MSNIVKREQQDLALNTMPEGLEGVDIGNISIPTAKLLQTTSTELQDPDTDLKAGQLIHSMFLEKISDTFVPVKLHEDNVLFVPKNDADKQRLKQVIKDKFGVELTDDDMSSMFICRAKDGKIGDRFGACASCQLNKFHGNDKPLCTANINVLAMFEGQDMPLVLRFSNTSFKHGKKLKDMLFMLAMSGKKIFSRKFKVVPTRKQENGNSWFEAVIKPAGNATEEEFEQAQELYNMFKGYVADVEIDEVESEY